MSYIKVPDMISKQIYLKYREILKLHHTKLEFYFIKSANKFLRNETRRHFDAASDTELVEFKEKIDEYIDNFKKDYAGVHRPVPRLTAANDISYYSFYTKNELNVMDLDKNLEERKRLFIKRVQDKYEDQLIKNSELGSNILNEKII
mmetsp:Transcript_4146/g.3474  ORF Transcript_4146/g.3474 Transcript_4146/m.3474 type:complete len:147 (+) Transcript_4146:18-458(+)